MSFGMILIILVLLVISATMFLRVLSFLTKIIFVILIALLLHFIVSLFLSSGIAFPGENIHAIKQIY